MNTPNPPSNSNVQQNLPTSLQVSAERLSVEVQKFGQDYVHNVFKLYMKPPSTIRKAAACHAPTFHDVTNRHSREATLFWLRFHIAETFAFIGIFDTVSKQQIVQTAELILDHEIYGQLNIGEFLVFLRKFKQGEYGKVYQSARPNPQEFILCLRQFWNELVEHRIHLARQEEQQRILHQLEADKADCMTREEYEEIKTLTRMYEMQIPPKVTH